MVGSANRGETPTGRTIEVWEHALRPAEQRAQPHEGHAGGQLPEDQNRHRKQHQADQSAAGLGAEGEGEGRKGGETELLEGRSRVLETEGSQARFLHGC